MGKRWIKASLMAGLALPLLCLDAAAKPSPPGAACKEPRSLSFIVLRVEKRPGGEFSVTFDDGQVWQQLEPDAHIELERGESVVIRRRGGGFVLESRTGLSTRVKRLR